MAKWRRLVDLFRRNRVSQSIEDELREGEPRSVARRRFDNAALHGENTRALDISRIMEDLFEDAAYAVRSLRRTPAFTAAALLTLALGIGATTVIYSLARTVWLRPLPYRDPHRVVRIWEKNSRLDIARFPASVPNFVSWRERSHCFEALVAMMAANANLTGHGTPERVPGLAVTAGFFEMLGLSPVLGRAFALGEDMPGHARVAMISERLWRQRFGGDTGLVGRNIAVNGENWTMIGVAPADTGFSSDIDIWQPLTLDPAREEREDHHIIVLGRLKPGVAVARAEAELNGLAAQLEREFPGSNRDWRVLAAPVLDWIVDRQTRSALVLLLTAAGLLLMVACINVANLLLARASSRVQEFGIRQALGAGGGRLVRQLVTESLVLASLGGGCGLFLASFGVTGLRALLPANIPRAAQLSLDFSALALVVALTVATGLVFGVIPAWAATRLDVQASIGQVRGPAGSGRLPLRRLLVAGEFALASGLVAGAGLLLASFHRLQSVDPGFEPRSVLTARISLPAASYSRANTFAFFRDLDRELNRIAGVQAADVASAVPFGGGGRSMGVGPSATTESTEQTVKASFQIARKGYFQALGIPLRRGRLFDERDDASEESILLSEGLARRLWPDGRDPIGRQVRLGDNPSRTVVGVVGDVRQLVLTEDPLPAAYVPAWPIRDIFVVVRAPGAGSVRMASLLRQLVAKIDPALPVFAVRTLEDLLDTHSAPHRLNAFLTASFALLALVLAAVGVGGVVSYSVLRRTPEIAIRMALGATPDRVVRAVIADGLRVCLLGLLAGLAGASVLGRLMARLLYHVRPADPAIFATVAAGLLCVALLANWLPAHKIAHIDPVRALRKE